jgi:hypothetical protein
MGIWYNNDGLRIKLGVDEARVTRGGEYASYGDFREYEVVIGPLTALGTSEAIQAHGVLIPAGFFIESVDVIANVAATSGGSATLDVGLIRQNTTTAYDDDGLVAALALASINVAGERTVLTAGVTSAGALIGTALANTGLITASYNTAAFTAGEVTVRIRGYQPWPAVTNQ